MKYRSGGSDRTTIQRPVRTMRLVAYSSFQIHLFGFKESYDTNHIVPALLGLRGIITNVLF